MLALPCSDVSCQHHDRFWPHPRMTWTFLTAIDYYELEVREVEMREVAGGLGIEPR